MLDTLNTKSSKSKKMKFDKKSAMKQAQPVDSSQTSKSSEIDDTESKKPVEVNETENFSNQNMGFENKMGNKRKNMSNYNSPNKKVMLFDRKEKKARKLLRKKKDSRFEVGQTLKTLWEELRREDCKPARKDQILKQVCDLLKGRVKEFTLAHDKVRVLECVFAAGAETHRSFLFEELKDEIIPLAKSKYGKFLLLKVLRYGNKQQKDAIIKAFNGKVCKLIRHTEAAEVVEFAFHECANARQKYELVQEFCGASYKYFKDSDVHSIKELFEKNDINKSSVISHMKEEIMKVLEKSVIKHSIVHSVLRQFMDHCDPASRSEVIESLREVVPEILHTKDGSRVAMKCIWHGTLRDRKIIMKSMKPFLLKIAAEEHGHMVLLTLFDCVDDTKGVKKHVIKELMANSLPLSQNTYGKKVLIYLLNPRDPHFFQPDVINILKAGDGNENSKKDPETRRSELKEAVAQPLLKLIISNIGVLYKDNSFCMFTLTILEHTVGDKTEAFQSIAAMALEPYSHENRNVHVIEHPGFNFLLKKLILQDVKNLKCAKDSSIVTFSEVLINTLPKDVMKSWMECNRGAFLLVSLIETEIPSVVERVKEEMTGCKTHLKKKSFKGAEILYSKLRD